MRNSVIGFLKNSRELRYLEEVGSVLFGLAFIKAVNENLQLSRFSVRIHMKHTSRKFGSVPIFSRKEDSPDSNFRIILG
jgi:hypothetical protein